MISMLQGWQGKVQVNGTVYNSIREVADKQFSNDIHIVLYSNSKKPENDGGKGASKTEYRITVKQWMTKPTVYDAYGHTEFDFMERWNNNVPMPLCVMIGTIEKETPGMYKMKLHGDIWTEKISTCMCCGRKLTNPVSQYFGIGPECGNHGYVNPFESEEELRQAVEQYRKKLQATTWEGWVVKSAIKEMKEVEQ